MNGYPDRVWCKSKSDSATGSNCRLNGAYTYPDNTYAYGDTTGGNIKYITGAPYYYRIMPSDYCTDQTLIDCITSAAPSGSYTVPAPVRYCDSTALDNCQAKYQGSFTRPRYTGFVDRALERHPRHSHHHGEEPAVGQLVRHDPGIYVKGVDHHRPARSQSAAPFNPNTAASDIGPRSSATRHRRTACVTPHRLPKSNVVTITAPAAATPTTVIAALNCSLWNGASVAVQSTGTPTAQATASFTVTGSGSGET